MGSTKCGVLFVLWDRNIVAAILAVEHAIPDPRRQRGDVHSAMTIYNGQGPWQSNDVVMYSINNTATSTVTNPAYIYPEFSEPRKIRRLRQHLKAVQQQQSNTFKSLAKEVLRRKRFEALNEALLAEIDLLRAENRDLTCALQKTLE
jgi:hypothetical protein